MEINSVNSNGAQVVQPRSPGTGQKPVSAGSDVRRSEVPLSKDKADLTQPEEEYFATAFPSASQEIRQHILYQKAGIRRPLLIGSVIDRRG